MFLYVIFAKQFVRSICAVIIIREKMLTFFFQNNVPPLQTEVRVDSTDDKVWCCKICGHPFILGEFVFDGPADLNFIEFEYADSCISRYVFDTQSLHCIRCGTVIATKSNGSIYRIPKSFVKFCTIQQAWIEGRYANGFSPPIVTPRQGF